MKKMNKVAAALICLGLAISTLCGCSSTSSGGEQPAVEEPTTKQSEAVTEAPATEETTESETTESEIPEGDVIIPLYDEYKSNELHQMLNATFTSNDDINNLFYYTNFVYFFSPVDYTDRRVDDNPEFGNLNEMRSRTTFEINDPYTGTNTEIRISFFCEIATERLLMYAEAPNGITVSVDNFVPLWYNQTQKYFVGYFKSENDGVTNYRMCTYYWHNNNWLGGDFEGDPSLYGF